MTPLVLAAPLALGLTAPVPAPARASAHVDPPRRTAHEEVSPRFGPPIVHALALFTTMRAAEAWIWPESFAETDLDVIGAHYRAAWTKPPIFDASRGVFEWDGDAWWLNGIGHGVLGTELYLRARVCGFGVGGSLAWAAVASATWEYVFEASGVRPSALDLVWTPLAGLAFGEVRHRLLVSARSIPDPSLRGFVRSVVDPFGEIEHAITGKACGR